MWIGSNGGASKSPPPPPPPPRRAHRATSNPKGAGGHNPSSAAASRNPSESNFDLAVERALEERAARDGIPTWDHNYETATIVKPDNTVYGIATAHGNSLPVEEADNAQISDPNLVLPGQVVFSPGQSPVSAATTRQIQIAQRLGSQEQWKKAAQHIAADLQAQANGKLLPDQIVQPTVSALDQWAIGNNRLREATQEAYNQDYNKWKQQGITSEQLAPILKDRQAAIHDDEALTHLHSSKHRARAGQLQTQAREAWAKVQQDTQQWLQSSIGLRAFPEDLGAQRVRQLDALFPHDKGFAAVNHAALQDATQTWQALGITHKKLGPVLDAYNAYETAVKERQQTLRNPHWHNEDPTEDSQLTQQVNGAWSRLQSAIEQQLRDAAKQSGSPRTASQAMLAQAGILRIVGPQTTDFRRGVDAANTYMQTNVPAQQVAAAYRRGGAAAAATTLLRATQNAAPGYAGSIITASRPTIDKIASDLNAMAQTGPVVTPGGQFSNIYGDLSASVEQTDHGTDMTAVSQQTRQAADVVATALASHMQTQVTDVPAYGTTVANVPVQMYADAAQDAIGDGHGATLSLALVQALQQRGQTASAGEVLEGSGLGYDELKVRTDSDVQSFAEVTGNLEQLRASWEPFMTTAQLDAATRGYARRNPQFVQQFAQTLSAVQKDGIAIVQARQAFSAYRLQLADLSTSKDLVDAANHLTGSDPNTHFAVEESGQVTMNVARALAEKVPTVPAGYSTALDAPGVLRSVRTSVNQYLKSKHTTPLRTADGQPNKPGPWTNGVLSAIGLGLTTPTALSELQHFDQLDFSGKAVFAYNALGFTKYTGETLSYATRLAQTSGIRYLSTVASGKVGSTLANLTNDSTTLGTAFKMFGSFYYLTGAFANGASAEEAASTGDIPEAALDSTNALGNLLLAGNASKDAISSTLEGLGIVDAGGEAAINGALDWAGPIGAVLSILAQFGLAAYSSYQQTQALKTLQSQGQGFLEDGLHLRPGIAYQLADVSDNQHIGPAPVLLAYAHQYHIQPQSLLAFLNKQNPTDVGSFVYLAEYLTPGKNGRYKATAPSDTPDLFYIPGVPYQDSVEFSPYVRLDSPNMPTSLRGLHYWAEAIWPGQNPQPTS